MHDINMHVFLIISFIFRENTLTADLFELDIDFEPKKCVTGYPGYP